MLVEDILFRGKRKDNGEWVYGYLFKGYDYLTGKPVVAIIEKDNTLYPASEVHYEEVIPETVGQYIGRCDYDGEKLFTDDLIQYVERHRFHPFCKADGVAMIVDNTTLDRGAGMYWRPQDTQVFTVIGNKHDNPVIYEKMREDAIKELTDRMARGKVDLAKGDKI